MKKHFIWLIVILAVLICVGFLCVKVYQDRTNPIKNRIASIDPEEITGCRIEWITMYDEYYEYIETNPEMVREIYDALAHMRFRKLQYGPPIGQSYYGIDLVCGEKEKAIFSYHIGTVLAPGLDVRYMAEITNLDELEEKYHWRTNLKNLILSAEAAREERINAAEATEPTEVTEATAATETSGK